MRFTEYCGVYFTTKYKTINISAQIDSTLQYTLYSDDYIGLPVNPHSNALWVWQYDNHLDSLLVPPTDVNQSIAEMLESNQAILRSMNVRWIVHYQQSRFRYPLCSWPQLLQLHTRFPFLFRLFWNNCASWIHDLIAFKNWTLLLLLQNFLIWGLPRNDVNQSFLRLRKPYVRIASPTRCLHWSRVPIKHVLAEDHWDIVHFETVLRNIGARFAIIILFKNVVYMFVIIHIAYSEKFVVRHFGRVLTAFTKRTSAGMEEMRVK